MDKQFIKVDDLVRQRLSGGEEPMLDGAWTRMNALLDKEPDERKPVFLFWRNTLSVASALVVLGLGGLGAYHFMGAKGQNETGKMVASAMNGAGSKAKVASTGTSASVSQAVRTAVNEAKGPEGKRSTGQKAVTAAAEPALAATAGGADLHETTVTAPGNHNAGSNNELTTHNKTVTHTNTNVAATTAGKNIENATAAVSATATNSSSAAAMNIAENRREIVGSATAATTDAGTQQTGTKAGEKPGTTAISGVHKHSAAQKISGKDPENAAPVATTHPKHKKVQNTPAQAAAETAGTTAANSAPGTNTGATGTSQQHALKVLAASTPSHTGKAVATVAKTNAHKAPATNGTPVHLHDGEGVAEKLAAETAADPAIAGKAMTHATGNSGTAGSGSSTTGSSTASHRGVHTGTGKTGHKAAVHQLPVAASTGVATKTTSASVASAIPAAPAAKRQRITVNKLTVHQRYFKTGVNEGYFSLDTISMEQLTREITTGGNSASAARMASANNDNTTSTGSNENAKGSAADEHVLASAAPAETPAVTTTKETATDKIKPVAKGTVTTAQKLSMAFNDMKSSVRGAQLAMGLTAGINGTFFGPAGFKGFQFGVTTEVTFNDNLSIMGELKYFNRSNTSDYSITDEYYTYEQQGGQYVKVTNLQTASFATIHSVELPLSARYSSGNFTFYAGGNFTYNFSINADLPTSGTVQNTTVVAAPGTNEAPQFSIDDFNARFGVGYLFGMNFRITPDFSLDLRNVQTLWDNSGSSSSKEVSGQLYRHPSFQFSVGYRLGGKKQE